MKHLDALAQLIAHARADTTDEAESDLHVPVSHFTSKERAASELAVLRRSPVIVAHESELPEPGDFLTRSVLGTPLLLVRQPDATVRVFRNMCPHRGGLVESDERGARRVFTCRYHGWSFDRDGGLRNVPYSSGFDAIDPGCNSLRPVSSDTALGFVWVALDRSETQSPLDVSSFLGPEVVAELESFDFADSTIFIDENVEVAANWKLVADGTIDMLHPKFLHPHTVGKYFRTNTAVWRDYGRHGQVFTARTRLERLENADAAAENPWSYMATNLVLYPNSLLIAAPDHVELWTIWPDVADPGRCRVNFRFLVRSDELDDVAKERMTRSWEILRAAGVDEDFPMEETIQVNAAATTDPTATFRYGRCELPNHHLHVSLQRDVDEIERTGMLSSDTVEVAR